MCSKRSTIDDRDRIVADRADPADGGLLPEYEEKPKSPLADVWEGLGIARGAPAIT